MNLISGSMKEKKVKTPKEPKIELELKTFEKEVEKEKEQSESDRIKNTPLDWSKPLNYSK